jgi:Pyruvate/2-oxoacid:ferredoxin oxidoreductase gamma subunit
MSRLNLPSARAPIASWLSPGAVVILNTTVFDGDFQGSPWLVVEIPATELSSRLGVPVAASMVMLGAYAACTGIVGLGSLGAAVSEALPSYRAQHAEINVEALRTGFGAVTVDVAARVTDAWSPAPTAVDAAAPSGSRA